MSFTNSTKEEDKDSEIAQLLSLWTSQELDAETPGDLSSSLLNNNPTTTVTRATSDPAVVSSKFHQTYLKCQKLLLFSNHQPLFNDNDDGEDEEEEDSDGHEEEKDFDDNDGEMTTMQQQQDADAEIQRNQKVLAKLLLPSLKSKQSKQRMIFLLVQMLVSRCCVYREGINSTTTSFTTTAGTTTTSSNDTNVAELLMNKLCDILSKAKVPLLEKTIQWFHQVQQQQQQQQQQQDSLKQERPSNWSLWKQEMMQALDAQLSHHGNGLWPVVLSLSASIFFSSDNDDDHDNDNKDKDNENDVAGKYLTVFLQHAIQQSLASATTLSLAQYYIASLGDDSTTATTQHVMEKVIPALALKLKANPETSLETVHEIFFYMDPSKVMTSSSRSSSSRMEHESQSVEETLTLVEQNMLPTVMKQLIHSKESMRHLSGSLLGILGRFDLTCRIVLRALGGLLLGTNNNGVMVKLTTAEHRLGVYRALEMIATTINNKRNGENVLLSCEEMNGICKAIVMHMAKETGKAKQVGMVALIKWMSCCQQEMKCLNGKEKGKEEEEDHDGYWLAIDFLSKAILDMKHQGGTSSSGSMAGMASEFRFRFEHLFTVCDYEAAEAMVSNLWEYAKRNGTEGKMCTGLANVVDMCTKKHGNSNIVAQVDGLIAAQILLIFTSIEINTGRRLDASIATLPPSVLKVLQSGGEIVAVDQNMTLQPKGSSLSFLYSRAMMDAYTTDPIVRQLLWRCIELYTKLVYTSVGNEDKRMKLEHKGIVRMEDGGWSAAAYAIACCVIQASDEQTKSDSDGEHVVVSSIESITTHTVSTDRASDAIAAAIFNHFNQISNRNTEHEQEPSHGIHAAAVRKSMNYLVKKVTNTNQFVQVMILSHCGLNFDIAHDFEESFDYYEEILTAFIDCGVAAGYTESNFADGLIQLISGAKDNEHPPFLFSKALHSSALSMIVTLGKIGATYDEEMADPDTEDSTPSSFAWKLCVKELAGKLADAFNVAVSKSEGLNEFDIALYNSPDGQLFTFSNVSDDQSKSKVAKSRMTEEEEWEKQVKMELEEKRKKIDVVPSLSKEEKNKIEEQTAERNRIRYILDWSLSGTLSFIRALCHSDIEIGNAILPIVSSAVTSAAVSTSAALNLEHKKKEIFSTLCTLAECVFEIDEQYAKSLANSLVTCQKRVGESPTELKTVEFHSNCEHARIALSAMDDYGDVMSGNSFVFLFPIIRAALIGPRTAQGCESALKILGWHTALIGKDSSITAILKDMAASILELVSHDRSKSFNDPSPIEALLSVYSSDKKPSAAELAPLLNESGALGNKNCRLASITVLTAILKAHPSLIRTNPVVENRVLVNCFAADESIKSEATRAWKIAQGVIDDDAPMSSPSKIFPVTMLPLLSHADGDISNAAAAAFAFGIERHSDSADKILNRLFNAYIDSYPTVSDQCHSGVVPATQVPPIETRLSEPKTKKAPKLDIGSVKKKPVAKKTASSAMAALTKTTATKKKSKPTSAIASFAPKKERVIDQESLMSQFVPTATESQKKEEKDSTEKIAIRSGVLRVISALTVPSAKIDLDPSLLQILVCFLITFGLSDVNEKVRTAASIALRDTVASDSFKSTIDDILPLLENALKDGKSTKSSLGDLPVDKVLDDIAATDHRKEGVVIALGSAAIHLRDVEDAEKISNTFNMLINALSTPSESVQASVAICLSKLMKKGDMKSKTEELLESQLQECLHGKTLAARRGAAYGISAIVKGGGIATLKKYSVVKQLEEACSTGSASTKEGSLFAIELLSDRLGLLFEPYVIVLLPALLKSFSDTSDHVRLAARNSVGLIMSKLSGHGVKLLVPAVLSGLEQEDWRTKQASIHMLGAMSQCAPKQLASCLPSIVPKVTEAFTDTHPKVKASAANSLEEISKVIRNPEISEISSVLLKALTDPSNGTVVALESLIETEFLHAIDAASLSLIVPIIHRGLRDRAATTKRYGALIAGNIVTMIDDPKDFVPYLPILLPDLKFVLLDPIPDCRSISAKALGSLTRSLGEATFPDLRTWLIEVLKDENGTSVERSGAAQGLTELLCAGGAGLVNEVMKDEILPLIDHPKASTREGVLWVLTFLPASLGQGFAPLIDASFPALISGLSDDSESVRDVAMRAGRVTIRSHGKAHVEKILPSLEDGLISEDYRIRSASLTLLGDLLSVLSGARISKGDIDTQDDIRQAERAQAQIALILGADTRKRVLSGLYLRRSDTAAVVRQAAVQVWKSVVSVTPRTLREILDTLVEQIVNSLASGHPDHTQVAGRCLGDIVRKLGDAVLPEIMPILKDALYRGDTHTKLGACVGLTEVIACSSKEQILKHLDILVRVVDEALCDNDDDVRKMAASCFQDLYAIVGNKVFDEIVPQLLAAMEGGVDVERARAINGITGILGIRSKELLPYLITRLVKKRPISTNQASALGSIFTVTGGSIHSYFSVIIPTLLSELSEIHGLELDEEDKFRESELRNCVRSLCGFVEATGINALIGEIATKCSNDKEGMRAEACWMMQTVIEERKEKGDFYDQIPIMLREFIHRLNDDSKQVLVAANSGLQALSSHVSTEELVNHVEFIRNLIASMVSDARRRKGGVGDGEFLLPGFNMPKGLEPLLPIYQRGILYGDASIREASAAGLGELMTITSAKFLAGPFIIKVTGPLLRIVGDRNPSAVKIAIIKTLGLILMKGGPALRAFVPQFQTTFLKALSDPSRQVRVEAIKALALLMPLSTRLDPLIKELVSSSLGNGAASSVDSAAGLVAIQTASLEALAIVVKHGGKQAKLPESIPSCLDAGKEMLYHDDEGIRAAAAKVIGAACDFLDEDAINDVAKDLMATGDTSPNHKHGNACLCHYLFASSASKVLRNDIFDDMVHIVKKYMVDNEVNIVREAACVAAGAVLGAADDSVVEKYISILQPSILKCMDPKDTIEQLKSMARGLSIGAQLNPTVFERKSSLPIIDAALKCAMTAQQRVQFAFNDFLWLALNVKDGESGLNRYCDEAMFENSKKMKSLYTKVLIRIKSVNTDDIA